MGLGFFYCVCDVCVSFCFCFCDCVFCLQIQRLPILCDVLVLCSLHDWKGDHFVWRNKCSCSEIIASWSLPYDSNQANSSWCMRLWSCFYVLVSSRWDRSFLFFFFSFWGCLLYFSQRRLHDHSFSPISLAYIIRTVPFSAVVLTCQVPMIFTASAPHITHGLSQQHLFFLHCFFFVFYFRWCCSHQYWYISTCRHSRTVLLIMTINIH